MNWQDRIVVDPDILVGKPVVKGTRLAVEFILELPAEGWSNDDILRNYPHLTREDVHAVRNLGSPQQPASRLSTYCPRIQPMRSKTRADEK